MWVGKVTGVQRWWGRRTINNKRKTFLCKGKSGLLNSQSQRFLKFLVAQHDQKRSGSGGGGAEVGFDHTVTILLHDH